MLLHRLIGKSATLMRTNAGTRQLLDGLKKTGIADWIKQANKRERLYPEMSTDLRAELDEYYAETIRRVEGILGRRVEAWCNRAAGGES